MRLFFPEATPMSIPSFLFGADDDGDELLCFSRYMLAEVCGRSGEGEVLELLVFLVRSVLLARAGVVADLRSFDREGVAAGVRHRRGIGAPTYARGSAQPVLKRPDCVENCMSFGLPRSSSNMIKDFLPNSLLTSKRRHTG